ncbi:TetR/AcrR family transcriptional regulator [Faecalicoccus pleomorphus]|uniref:TetR/AcrR family transcriptional regulator n=1 Tax=Faecalicoccus pleomorphus TaxID=1323 RepID=UPI002430F0B5|nr:TetR/AcrR family transcriptional regulator [Faecalicoccus pleomorphus]
MDTKYIFADALKTCMKKSPYEKITVKDITDTCNLSRQTFYRHFLDKQDLVNWYFDKILQESFQHMGEGKTIYEALFKKFTFILQEKLFFRAAFQNDDQNNLRDHDFELILSFYTDRIQSKAGMPLSSILKFQLEMYCQSSIYMTVKWLLEDTPISPATLASQLCDAMPPEVKKAFVSIDLL